MAVLTVPGSKTMTAKPSRELQDPESCALDRAAASTRGQASCHVTAQSWHRTRPQDVAE